MAIPSTSASAPVAQASAAPAPSAPRKSYLACCVEDLSPNKLSAYEKNAALYMRRAMVTAVASTALAIVAFVFTSMYFPVFAPVVAFTALISAFYIGGAFMQKNVSDAASATANAAECHAIKIHYDALMQLNSSDLLNPIRAKARQLDSKIQKFITEKEKFVVEARKLETETPELTQKIINAKGSAIIMADRALDCKIKAAFVNAVLRRGDFNGTLDDIATCSKLSSIERMAARVLDEPVANEFLTFKAPQSHLPPITYEEVKRLSIEDLGTRIFSAMPAA